MPEGHKSAYWKANKGKEVIRIWEQQPQSFVSHGTQFCKTLFSVKVTQVATVTMLFGSFYYPGH